MSSILGSDEDESDGTSNAETSASESHKPRNIAVKRGTPLPNLNLAPSSAQKVEKGVRFGDLNLLKGTTFLQDFNPENSRREKNKRHLLTKPRPPIKKNNTSLYDEQGRFRSNCEDICDCFESECPGCHFPCETCGSAKCGPRCRVNRKWAYESITFDGKSMTIMNPMIATILRN